MKNHFNNSKEGNIHLQRDVLLRKVCKMLNFKDFNHTCMSFMITLKETWVIYWLYFVLLYTNVIRHVTNVIGRVI